MERRSRARLIGATAIALASAVAGARAASGVEQRGIFALLAAAPKIVSTARSQPSGNEGFTLVIRQFRTDGKSPILKYDVDLQKLIHLIVVRDDFQTFRHLHPAFDPATGTFRQQLRKDADHRYYVYADTTPHGIGQQVFRFTISRDGSTAAAQPPPQPFSEPVSQPRVTAGAYRVVLARTTLNANEPQSVDLTVLRDGTPARDLGLYLGATAHAVFIDIATLEYVHVHPTVRGAPAMTASSAAMQMTASERAGPLMTMRVPALSAGTYGLWIQFSDARGSVYTAPFTMRVR